MSFWMTVHGWGECSGGSSLSGFRSFRIVRSLKRAFLACEGSGPRMDESGKGMWRHGTTDNAVEPSAPEEKVLTPTSGGHGLGLVDKLETNERAE